MLTKSLKYELQATARYFFPVYICFAITTVLLKIMIEVSTTYTGALQNIFLVISGMCYGIAVIAVFLMCSIICFYRFYKNIYTDEGYLTLTLPVSADVQILSKMIVNAIWTVITSGLFVLSLVVLAAGHSILGDLLHGFLYFCNSANPVFMIETILISILSLFANPLLIYMAVAIGGMVEHHKVMASIGSYFGIMIVLSFITNIVFSFGPAVEPFATSNLIITSSNEIPTFIHEFTTGFTSSLYPLTLILCIVQMVVCYFGTRYLLKNKVNI